MPEDPERRPGVFSFPAVFFGRGTEKNRKNALKKYRESVIFCAVIFFDLAGEMLPREDGEKWVREKS